MTYKQRLNAALNRPARITLMSESLRTERMLADRKVRCEVYRDNIVNGWVKLGNKWVHLWEGLS